MNEKYYTVKEIAERFRVSRQAVYDWITAGKLGAIKVGERVRVPETAVQQFIEVVKVGERVIDPEDAGRGNIAPMLVYA